MNLQVQIQMLVRLSQLDASSPLSGLTIYKTQSIMKLFFDNLLVVDCFLINILRGVTNSGVTFFGWYEYQHD